MNPQLQEILHNITTRLTKLEQAEKQEPVSRLYSIEPHGNGYAIYCGRDWQHHGMNIGHLTEVTPAAIKLIETALNQKTGQAEKQEPVAWMTNSEQDVTAEFLFSHVQTPIHNIPLYEAPPRKPWVGLTDEEINKLDYIGTRIDFVRAIEAKLKEKNT